MQKTNDLYMPVFYSYLEATKSLSNEEFGKIVRMLLAKLGSEKDAVVSELSDAGKIAYAFMLDGATRIIGRGANKSDATYKATSVSPTPKRQGNFDPRAAFEKALERSYGKKEPEQK